MLVNEGRRWGEEHRWRRCADAAARTGREMGVPNPRQCPHRLGRRGFFRVRSTPVTRSVHTSSSCM